MKAVELEPDRDRDRLGYIRGGADGSRVHFASPPGKFRVSASASGAGTSRLLSAVVCVVFGAITSLIVASTLADLLYDFKPKPCMQDATPLLRGQGKQQTCQECARACPGLSGSLRLMDARPCNCTAAAGASGEWKAFSLPNGPQSQGSFLQSTLEAAEAEYVVNLKRRLLTNKTLLELEVMPELLFKSFFFVPLYPCAREGRFGQWGEGGKWVCQAHYDTNKQSPTAISVGCRGETSFEKDLYERLNASIHAFAFTLNVELRAYLESLTIFKFHNAGLAGRDEVASTKAAYPQLKNATVVDVPGMLKVSGLPFVDIFKIDCEGCEHGVVDDLGRLYNKDNAPFGQIQIEVHGLGKKLSRNIKLVHTLEQLGYRMFHAEANAYDTKGFELAFIHEKLVKPR